jgi:hypothetical protein
MVLPRRALPLLCVLGCASPATAPPAPNALGAMAGEPAPWPWRHGQLVQVAIQARGQRNVGALAQRWDMTLAQRWQISLETSTKMTIAIETPGEWQGTLAAPDASAGTGYYLGFVTGLVMDDRGQVLSVEGGEAARAKARQKVASLGSLPHTAGAELDRGLDDAVLARAWTRPLRRIAELRTTRADRSFTEPATFTIAPRAVPVAYQLTRKRIPCRPDTPDTCLRIELAGHADPATLRAAAANPALEDVTRGTLAWLLLSPRRAPAEVGDRLWGRELWKTDTATADVGLEDEIILRFGIVQ